MSFMPGDRQGGVPQSVEVEWIIYSPEFMAWSDNVADSERYSKKNEETYRRLWATNRRYVQRVDLTTILTPDIVAKVLADRENTQLKMTVVFRDDKMDITAEPYKWR